MAAAAGATRMEQRPHMVVDDTPAAHHEVKTAHANLIQAERILGLSRSDLCALLGIPADRLDAPQT